MPRVQQQFTGILVPLLVITVLICILIICTLTTKVNPIDHHHPHHFVGLKSKLGKLDNDVAIVVDTESLPSLREWLPRLHPDNSKALEGTEERFKRALDETIDLAREINHPLCRNMWRNLHDSQFINIDASRKVFVYSVYLDEHHGPVGYYTLRVFLYKRNHYYIPIYGTFFTSDGVFVEITSPVETTSLPDYEVNFNTFWSGSIMTFQIAKGRLDNRIPCVFGLSTNRFLEILLPVRRTWFIRKTIEHTVCVGPIRRPDYVSPAKLIEFFGVLSAVGVDQVAFYLDERLTPWYVKEILANKTIIGSHVVNVDIIRWSIPNGQSYSQAHHLMANECLFRYMASSRYVQVQNLDEAIIPSANFPTINSAMNNYFHRHKDETKACFHTIFYPTYFLANRTIVRNVFYMTESLWKCQHIDEKYNRCIYRPEMTTMIILGRQSPSSANLEMTIAFASNRYYHDPPISFCRLGIKREFIYDDSIFFFVNQSRIELFKKFISNIEKM